MEKLHGFLQHIGFRIPLFLFLVLLPWLQLFEADNLASPACHGGRIPSLQQGHGRTEMRMSSSSCFLWRRGRSGSVARAGGQLLKTLSRGDLVADRTGTGAWVRKLLRFQRFWLLNREQWQRNFAARWFHEKRSFVRLFGF